MNDAVQHLPDQEQARKQRILDEVKKELKKVKSYTPKVGVFGDTGVGKSTLCNALFGKDIAKISDVEACTREPQEILVGGENGDGIILVDVPGVGEDAARHQEYIDLYKSLVPELDLVLWAIKSDDRKYMSSIDVYKEVLEPNLEYCPVVFTITQSEKIEPWDGWDPVNNKPGEDQQANLVVKVNDVSSRFDVSTNKIVPISSGRKYNLVELVNKVIEVLPNEKKYSFTREAKEENVSEEAAKNAAKGVIDYIKEKIGDTWDSVKDDVLDAAKDLVVEYAPKIAKKVISWFKSRF